MENNISKIIRERRSHYPNEFNGKRITDEQLGTLLENANYAPNHKSNYPWRFVIIGPGKAKEFTECAADIYKTGTDVSAFKEKKFEKILAYGQQVSHFIAIVMDRDPDSKTILNEDICAVAAAVQNIYLSLSLWNETTGYWSTGLGTYSPKMRDYLGLNETQTLLGFFVLGCVDKKRTETGRRNYKDFVRFL